MSTINAECVVAEREGFEPPELSFKCFQDIHLRPLGHLSTLHNVYYCVMLFVFILSCLIITVIGKQAESILF